MRRPQLSRRPLLAAGLLLAVGTATGIAFVAHRGPTGSTSSLTAATDPSPTATLSATPAPSPSPTASPTPMLTLSPTAIATVGDTPTPGPIPTPVTAVSVPPKPSPTPTEHPQTVTVSITGPTEVIEGVDYVYTFRTTWNHERPAFIFHGFSSPGGLPTTDGCDPPSHPPVHDGPGSTSERVHHTWTIGEAVTNIQMQAFTNCQWYTGGAGKVVDVHVSPAPTPSPSATPSP